MNFQKLSDSDLLSQTKSLVREETRLTTEVLHHLREIEARKLFCALGFSSLFEYAVRELGYSEASAQRRIASMRLLKELPQVEDKIKNGDLSLTVVAQAQSFFKQEAKSGHALTSERKEEVMKSLEGKSSREAERTLIAMSPEPARSRPDCVRSVTETVSEIRFTASDELVKDIEKLKGLLAHQHPDLSIGELFQLLAKRALKELDPGQKEVRPKRMVSAPTVKPPETSPCTIPVATKRAVWRRDGSRCTYVDPKTGRRCESRHRLQIDHRQPKGLGGGNEITNLRLLCAQHNAFEAARVYGREMIQTFWRS
ncbi:MAG: HNH endonuclease signature motif containing protein [Oligoflexia bacterium]|nr:HNH endonuclease signature motif containing protein [Oligoflexia bacterium]